MDAALAEGFDLRHLPAGFVEDPYPYYHALRAADPVREMPDGSYFLTAHADLDAVYRDTATFSSDKKREFAPKFGDGPLYRHHTTSLVFNDPPLHTRVRRMIAGALTPRAVTALAPSLVRLVDGLLDAMGERGEADLIEDFASAIPIEVIGNMLGVPRDERGPLREWSLAILGALEPSLTPAQLSRGEAAVTEFVAYLRGLIEDRRRRPGDPAQDVLTRLIRGEGGDGLSADELEQNCIFILNAGHETTTNLIGNALQALLDWPEERLRLQEDPLLIRSAVEEFLRFESSNQIGNRMTMRACVVGGKAIAEGTGLTLCIGAANRDPAVFADPDRLDLARSPNRHLAFAAGPHVCAGMAVARLEGGVAIGRFLQRFPAYRAAGAPVRGGRVRFRGYLSIPVKLG